KFVGFNDKAGDEVLLEGEGGNRNEVYVQGLCRSVREDVEGEMLERIGGVEKGDMMRGG
ncbi:FAD-dependent oxidoreductase, partial [Staphylococcus aureus]|uniref:FAD-dependent oxidoreductase n=1 Tax=Staphylococcus aureus TaxID=1280 RepID=UPI0011A2F011